MASFSHFRACNKAESVAPLGPACSREETYTFVLAIDNHPAAGPGGIRRLKHDPYERSRPGGITFAARLAGPLPESGYTLDRNHAVVRVSTVLSGFAEVTAIVGAEAAVESAARDDRFQLEIVLESPFGISDDTFGIDLRPPGPRINLEPTQWDRFLLTGTASLTVIRHSDGAASYIGKLARFEGTEQYGEIMDDEALFLGIDENDEDAEPCAEPTRIAFGTDDAADGIIVNSDTQIEAFMKVDQIKVAKPDAQILTFCVSIQI